MGRVERERLEAMLANGPERRMAQDAARGLGPELADVLQAAAYRAELAGLARGGEDSPAPEPRMRLIPGNDPLGLDRSRAE